MIKIWRSKRFIYQYLGIILCFLINFFGPLYLKNNPLIPVVTIFVFLLMMAALVGFVLFSLMIIKVYKDERLVNNYLYNKGNFTEEVLSKINCVYNDDGSIKVLFIGRYMYYMFTNLKINQKVEIVLVSPRVTLYYFTFEGFRQNLKFIVIHDKNSDNDVRVFQQP